MKNGDSCDTLSVGLLYIDANKSIFTFGVAELIIKKMNSAEQIRKQRCNGTLNVSTTLSLSLLKNAGFQWRVVDVWIFDFRRHYLR